MSNVESFVGGRHPASFTAGPSVPPFRSLGQVLVSRPEGPAWRDAGVYNVIDYGAKGNGTADDTAAVRAAVTAACANPGSVVLFPDGGYKITSPIAVSAGITIAGQSQFRTLIVAVGCNAIEVASGISNFSLLTIELALAVRHTSTPNTLVGLLVNGSTGSRPFNHVYRDVYIDGFQTAIEANWLWSSTFFNVKSNHGAFSIKANGLSVNNFVSHCSFSGDRTTSSRGITLGDGNTATEGWVITDSLIDAFGTGVYGHGSTHNKVSNCIIDHCTQYGIVVIHAGIFFGSNWEISNNYIALEGTATDGINLANGVGSSQDRGCRVIGNQVLVYSGSTADYGIQALGSSSRRHAIIGNTLSGFAVADITARTDGNVIISNNTCLSSVSNNIYGGTFVSNNAGTQYYERAVQRVRLGPIDMTWDEAAPTTGTWTRGSVCWKVNPSAGGTPGWVCTAAGSPGTWTAMANLV